MPSRRTFLKTALLAAGAVGLRESEDYAAAPPAPPALDTFQARRNWVLGAAAADPRKSGNLFWTAQACFLRGKDELGKTVWHEAMRREMNARVRGVELFNYWPAIHGVARWRDRLDPSDVDEIARLLSTFREYAAMRTANLVTLAQVTRYLAGQTFGEEHFVPEAHYRPNDHNAARALRQLIGKCTREGFGEWASWPYYDKNILPILSLGELAGDLELRRMARLAFEAGLAQNAAFWLHGRWAMSTGRSYPDLLAGKPWGGAAALWLYFGGASPEVNGNLVGAAVMDYEPPHLIQLAATDRNRAFTSRSRFYKNLQVAYLDRTYGLFSEMQDEVCNWGQSYPYGVTWDDPDPSRHNCLWLTAPINDTPESVSPSHPHGVNSRAQSNVQHESASLYVFHFDSQVVHPYALGFVPGGQLACIDEASHDGRIFLHYAGVLIAIQASRPFPWDRAAGVRAPSGNPQPGDSEFRVTGDPLAIVLDCAQPTDFPAANPDARLAAFRAAILARTRLELEGFTARYKERRGNLLERTFHGPALVNRLELRLSGGPLLDNPWMKQDRGGPLTLTDDQETRSYDFNRWVVTCSPPST